MNSMKIEMVNRYVIIDNRNSAIVQLKKCLVKLGVSEKYILTPGSDAGTTRSWMSADDIIAHLPSQGWDPRERCTVLFLDIALDDQDADVAGGIEKLHEILDNTQDFVRILYSGKIDQAKVAFRQEQYDGILSKARFRGTTSDLSWEISLLRSVISDATRKWRARRKGVPCDSGFERKCVVEDSLALRMFEASYGKDALDDVVSAVIKHGTTGELPKVELASGGYSGSNVILLRYNTNAGNRRVAIKLDRRKDVLDHEFEKIDQVSAAAHKWSDLPIPVIANVLELPIADESLYYFSQAFFDGDTLERIATRDILAHGAKDAVRTALNDISLSGVADIRECILAERFPLTREDELRFLSSIHQVEKLIPRLSENDSFKKTFVDSGRLEFKELIEFVRVWADGGIKWKYDRVCSYEQHGDMNPRNIMLVSQGDSYRVKLIDFARFGVWPPGYDLSRLRLQLAFRLLDPSESLSDCFPNRINFWNSIWYKGQPPSNSKWKSDPSSVCYENFRSLKIEIDSVMKTLLKEFSTDDSPSVHYSLLVGELWDAIKMCSYQDASWFKRIWFASLANDIYQKLMLRKN